ncbi:MAG: bifunctional oligoribonuclease/PAP phosphatase NrnA [Mycoplasmataceae bacterium]|nr:bifunctional oligoribonuclease/PAP phosphatase NrnA [Mycoplasmataceae bacterium]
MKNIIKKINEYNKIALFQHIQPDGDSISSSIGLGMAIKEAFPDKEVVIVADYEYLTEHFKFLKFDKKMFKAEIDDSYLGIVGDVAVAARVVNIEQLQKAKEIVCFDHHQNETDLNPSHFWHEPSYPASALQAYEIAKEFGVKFSEDTSMMLMVGILTDTGFFKYSAANPKPLKIVSELFENISDDRMRNFHIGMATRTKQDLEIQAYILQNIKYDGRLSYVVFPEEIVEKYGPIKLKIKVNSIGNIEGSEMWAFFLETKDDDGNKIWSCNLRSSKPKIVLVAKKWGGGGHFLACGARVKTFDEVKQVIKDLNAIKENV